MYGPIKPIQTRYNGYYFRSRTEARWAVFFDQMGVKFEYEQEGFKLKNGSSYLPDFFINDLCGATGYFEVKPGVEIQKEWLIKLKLLFETTGINGYLLSGPPDFRGYVGFEKGEWVLKYFFAFDKNYVNPFKFELNSKGLLVTDKTTKDFFHLEYVKAVYAARAARF